MTEAQEIIARLETERHRLMLKHAQLGEEATRLAYAVLVRSQFLEKMTLRDVSDEADHIMRQVAMYDLALTEARRRGSGSLIPLVATSRQVSRS
jgi:hypothetical protein